MCCLRKRYGEIAYAYYHSGSGDLHKVSLSRYQNEITNLSMSFMFIDAFQSM